MTPPRVLMVTGSYYPEITGAGLQCRQLVRALGDRISCEVLTTSNDPALASGPVDGVPVHRVLARGRFAAPRGALALLRTLWRRRRHFDLVHLHGFSRKSVLVVLAARLLGKRVVIKLTSVGHDDPPSLRRRAGALAYWCYRRADLFIGVSARQAELYAASGLDPARFRLVPNGVDLARFRPAGDAERARARTELGLAGTGPVILFVGFFSPEKCPDALFEAWASLSEKERAGSSLLLVGATQGPYYEIDPALAPQIRAEAERRGLAGRVRFIERIDAIETCYRAATHFVLPSLREGMPNALLEAMASGVACVASRLPGVTDTVIDHGTDGWLVPPADTTALAAALAMLLGDAHLTRRLGDAARRTVEARFPIAATADGNAAAYAALLGRPAEGTLRTACR
ncbi:MAG: glycosyltransferase family 4 protein [Candidatus Rokubacteria bacterium]|nr:glycosyltransferase family 4 protein [Candidatus Rokubacteria bacterium]